MQRFSDESLDAMLNTYEMEIEQVEDFKDIMQLVHELFDSLTNVTDTYRQLRNKKGE